MERFNTAALKRIRKISIYFALILAIMALLAAGCGGSDDDNEATAEGTTGTLTLSLTDATSDDYQAVYVTISEVRAQLAEEGSDGDVDEEDPDTTDWEVVTSDSGTYNLLELVNGVIEQLGVTELQTGHYPQMRLYLGDVPADTLNILNEDHPYANYVINKDDSVQELFIPSGYQSGIKLVNAFDIEAGLSKELVLDFDVKKSIIKPGVSGKIILKPTIKVIDVINRPVVTGTIFESDGTTQISGAYVSAQIYDEDATDIKDQIIAIGTITDENGGYRIILDEGYSYNIVAWKGGYTPNYIELAETELNTTYDNRNINLSAAESSITFPITVNIEGEPEEGEVQSATISFRQDAGDVQIEVYSENTEDQEGEGSIRISLPEGIYDIVSSSDGFDTQILNNENIAGENYKLEIDFPETVTE